MKICHAFILYMNMSINPKNISTTMHRVVDIIHHIINQYFFLAQRPHDFILQVAEKNSEKVHEISRLSRTAGITFKVSNCRIILFRLIFDTYCTCPRNTQNTKSTTTVFESLFQKAYLEHVFLKFENILTFLTKIFLIFQSHKT